MRVLALHEDLVVAVSAFWQTTATFVRSGEEGFLIDSPVLPAELEALPSLSAQARFPVSGLLVTHADWDHLLGRQAFPEATLGMGESSAARLGAEPGAAQRSLRAFDDEHYIDGRPPLRLGGVQALPVPGRLSLGGENGGENGGEGERELELHPAAGHTADGTAYLLPWLGTLVCGDYLSPVEIPMLSAGGSIDAYLGTLMTLGGLLDRVETVVPGHGGPQPRERAERILEQDVAYLETLRDTGDAPLPAGRGSAEQRRIHDRNVARLGSG